MQAEWDRPVVCIYIYIYIYVHIYIYIWKHDQEITGKV